MAHCDRSLDVTGHHAFRASAPKLICNSTVTHQRNQVRQMRARPTGKGIYGHRLSLSRLHLNPIHFRPSYCFVCSTQLLPRTHNKHFHFCQSQIAISNNMSSQLVPSNPTNLMAIRNVTPNIVTFSVPFARFGKIHVGGRGTLGKPSHCVLIGYNR